MQQADTMAKARRSYRLWQYREIVAHDHELPWEAECLQCNAAFETIFEVSDDGPGPSTAPQGHEVLALWRYENDGRLVLCVHGYAGPGHLA